MFYFIAGKQRRDGTLDDSTLAHADKLVIDYLNGTENANC